MEYLRELYEQMGFACVQTYIQSGNIIFESQIKDTLEVNSIIESGLRNFLGYQVVSFIRGFEEWENIISSNPFPKQTGDPDYKYYVTFLRNEPEEAQVSKLLSFCNDYESYILKGKELFVLLKKSTLRKEIFSNNFVESKLKTPATTRNWNTILKILEYRSTI